MRWSGSINRALLMNSIMYDPFYHKFFKFSVGDNSKKKNNWNILGKCYHIKTQITLCSQMTITYEGLGLLVTYTNIVDYGWLHTTHQRQNKGQHEQTLKLKISLSFIPLVNWIRLPNYSNHFKSNHYVKVDITQQ